MVNKLLSVIELNMVDKKKELIEHRHPTPATQKNVLAASGNQCVFPDVQIGFLT